MPYITADLGGSAHTEVFVVSFCTDGGDRLSQWRGYGGGGGAGYAVGFKSLQMMQLVTPGPKPEADGSAMLVKVAYSEEHFRELVRAELEFRARGVKTYCRTHSEFAQELYIEGMKLMHLRASTLALRLKHEKFAEEEEWRLVVSPRRTLDAEGKPVVHHRARDGVRARAQRASPYQLAQASRVRPRPRRLPCVSRTGRGRCREGRAPRLGGAVRCAEACTTGGAAAARVKLHEIA